MRHYDPHDHRLGYVTVCKPQNYTSPTASRQYDKFKVVAECLNLESVDLFNSQKFVARRHYPPEVCEFFWDSHNPGELLHKATQIRVLARFSDAQLISSLILLIEVRLREGW